MKKSKVVLAIILAVILLVICVNGPTFSWFTRPYPATQADYTGNELNLVTKNAYTAYNGVGVSMSTTACTTGAAADYASVTTAAGLGGSNIGTGDTTNRKYYCTTITNSSGSTAQNISLYAHALQTNTNQFAIGVNSPMRTYHDFVHQGTATAQMAYYSTRRIYFQRPDAWDDDSGAWWDWTNGQSYYICRWPLSGEPRTYTAATNLIGHNNLYYVDIPFNDVHGCYLKTSTGDTATYRTENIEAYKFPSNADSVKIYVWHQTGDNDNVKVNWDTGSYSGANIYRYYSNISMDPGSTFDASLSWPDMKGKSIKYSSSDSSVFTVDENTGIITAGSSNNTATLTTKVIGEHDDYQEATTTVSVQTKSTYDYVDEPIVKNISVPAYAGRGQDGDPPAVKVYWYIKNNSNSSLTYTIDRIYLGP